MIQFGDITRDSRTGIAVCRYEGERPMAGSAEHIDTKTRVVATTPPGPVCPTGLAPDAATRRHRRRGSRSSSSSSSGDEREGGYHRAAGGTVPVSGGVGVGGHVASVLREDQSEVVCGRKEFTEVRHTAACTVRS